MKLRYIGIDVGPISLTDISSSITAGPAGIAFNNIVGQNQVIPPGPTVIELQDSDEVIKSFQSGQLNSYIASGNFVVDVPPLTSAEFIPGEPLDWQVVPPNDIYEALDQAADIASSYRDGTATIIKLADGSDIGDATHRLANVFTNSLNSLTTFDAIVAGVSRLNIDATRTLVDQDLEVSGMLTLSADPVNPLHAVTKQYADSLVSAMDIKTSVRVASTGDLMLVGLVVVDGVTLIAGDRVLVKDQALAKDNGIYVASAGVWSRSADADTDPEVNAATFIFVEEGSINADTGWVLTTDNPFVLGTDDINFTKFTENITAGTGLVRLGNVISIDSLYTGQTSISTLGTITTGTWNGSVVDIAYGGTNLSSLGTLNQMLGVNAGATALEYKTLSGTLNQIDLTFGVASITFSLPQDIHTGSSPEFTGLKVSGLTPLLPVFTDGTSLLTTNAVTGSGSVVMSISPAITGAMSTQHIIVGAGYDVTLGQDPTSPLHAATKQYVDNTAQGLDVKESVRLATTSVDGNIDLATGGLLTIDSVATANGDRVLVKNQTLPEQNGVYIASTTAWVRSADTNSSVKVTSGMFTFVCEGTENANFGFVLSTDDPIVLTVTPLTFSQFSGAGSIVAGGGISQSGNQFDVGTADVSRIVINANDIDLAMTGISAGTYTKLTVDAYGRATVGALATTTDIAEGTNLYFTDSRARLALSGTAGRIDYNSATGQINIDAAYIGQSTITTLGTIGAGTWQGSVIGIAYGGTNNTSFTTGKFVEFDGTKLASTAYDSTSFLAPSAVSGTSGKLAKFTGANAVGDSVVGENSGRIFIGGVDDGLNTLQVNGPTKITGSLNVDSGDIMFTTAGNLLAVDEVSTLGDATHRFSAIYLASVIDIKAGHSLQIGHGTNDFVIHSSGRILIGTNVDDGVSYLQVNGNAVITGSLQMTQPSTLNGVVMASVVKTTNYTLTNTDYTVEFDCTSGNLVATLPAAPEIGRMYNVCKNDAGGNSVTLNGGGYNIDGQPSLLTAVQYFNWTIQFNGAEWRIL